MTISNWVIALAFLFEAAFWLSVYYLIIRTGFKEKIHAMPVLAMAGNISWEFMLGMGSFKFLGGPFETLNEKFPACPASWPDCPELIGYLTLAAALMDVVIAYIIIKWGRNQIEEGLLKKYWPWLVPVSIAGAFAILVTSVNDLFVVNPYEVCSGTLNVGCVAPKHAGPYLELTLDGGFTTGAVLAISMGLMFLHFLRTRPDLRGQSFWIGLFMALGNTSAYIVAMLWSGFQLTPLAHVLSVVSLTINYTYVVLYVRQAREIGIDPYQWKAKEVAPSV